MAAVVTTGRTGVMHTVARRLLPLLLALYVVNFLDRANIGVAALAMNTALHLNATAYGTAAGTFFLGYVLFQIPAGTALRRFGARRWLSAVIIAWGVCSAATALVTDAHTLYVARFTLGLAEAGFFPGVIAYLAAWFPRPQRARAMAVFLLAIPVSNVLGLPASGLLVEHGAVLGLPGWRSMFLIEAVPAMVLGLVARRLLPDSPRQAAWLTEAEREDLELQLAADTHAPGEAGAGLVRCAAHFAGVYAGLYFGLYALQFFLPQLTAALFPGTGTTAASVLAALPYLAAAPSMLAWSRRCDRTAPRVRLIAVPVAAAAAAAAALALWPGTPVFTLATLVATVCGILAAIPVFWSQCTARLTGPRATTAIAAVNATSSLASFAGPYMTGRLKDATGSYHAALLLIALVLAAAAAGALRLPRPAAAQTREPAPSRAPG